MDKKLHPFFDVYCLFQNNEQLNVSPEKFFEKLCIYTNSLNQKITLDDYLREKTLGKKVLISLKRFQNTIKIWHLTPKRIKTIFSIKSQKHLERIQKKLFRQVKKEKCTKRSKLL